MIEGVKYCWALLDSKGSEVKYLSNYQNKLKKEEVVVMSELS
jgi:hypothetical protein